MLSTHYRRPIEYSEAELESKRKGLDTFYRLFERVERLCESSPYERVSDLPSANESQTLARTDIRSATLASTCDEYTSQFRESMDDDFNTAGAIAAMFEWAAAVNRFIEQSKLESTSMDAASTDANSDALQAARRLVAVGRLIGLFLDPPAKKSAADGGLTDTVMQVLIEVRQHLRKKKDFETADLIRDLLTDRKITLEDRPDGTHWRAE